MLSIPIEERPESASFIRKQLDGKADLRGDIIPSSGSDERKRVVESDRAGEIHGKRKRNPLQVIAFILLPLLLAGIIFMAIRSGSAGRKNASLPPASTISAAPAPIAEIHDPPESPVPNNVNPGGFRPANGEPPPVTANEDQNPLPQVSEVPPEPARVSNQPPGRIGNQAQGKVCANDAIFFAVKMNNLKAAKELLDKDPKLIHAMDQYGAIPLHWAVGSNMKEMTELLIKYKSDVNMRDWTYKYTPLHTAVNFGRIDIVNLLIANGAEIDPRAYLGQTPLHMASYGGHDELVEILVSKGADLNAKDRQGRTPLFYAESYGRLRTAGLLKKYGAKKMP